MVHRGKTAILACDFTPFIYSISTIVTMPHYARLLLCAMFCIAPWLLQAQDTPTQPATPIIIEKASPLTISGIIEICKGSETILKAEGDFESFTWDKDGVTGRYLKVKEEGVYEVSAKTKGGCTFTTSVNVRVRPCS